MAMAEDQPEILYLHWDYVAALLKRENTHSKYIGIHLLARLAVVDKDDKFKAVFAGYYHLLGDKSVISAAHVAGNSGRMAKAKPELEARITERLLGIDKTRHKPGHRELIKSYAIDAFNEYFAQTEDKKRILTFVRKQLDSESPKTRKKVREFLNKWENWKNQN